MKEIMKKAAALTLAAALCVTQLALPVLAETAPETAPEAAPVTTVEVDVTSLPGGVDTEAVSVDVVVTNNADGTVTAIAQTASGGDVTDSGSTVNYTSETVTDAAGVLLSQETSYDAASADGSYTAQGGSETTVEPNTEAQTPDLTVDLMDENGNLVGEAAVGGETTTEIKEGSILESENPANFDQTTVTTSDRKLEVEVSGSTITSGDPTYLDENGNPLPSTDDGYDYTNGRKDEKTGYGVSWNTAGGEHITSGSVTEWKLTNTETGETIDGLYCVDASITTKPYGLYRLVNLEDAVEEGYYTEDDAAHLRAIVTLGYTWDSVNNSDNVDEMNKMLKDAGVLVGEEALTSAQAAAVTNMCIWKYGNRFGVDNEDLVPTLYGNGITEDESTMMMAVYDYLTAQTMDSEETQVIDEEKFISNLDFTVGSKVENHAANYDDDNTNDVYNTAIKFSMVVTPGEGDDLIVKVMDSAGNVVKAARIAGSNQEGETEYEDAVQVEENGTTYYVIEGMELAENSDTTFNLKLEGHQLLEQGVYVFEAQAMTVDQMYEAYAKYAGKTVEQIKDMLANYDQDTIDQLCRSQNFTTLLEGTADVSVSMQIDLTFNVEESTITTEHTWRSEQTTYTYDYTGGEGGGTPRMGRRMLRTIEEEEVPLAEEPELEVEEELDEALTIADEEVPLAAAPATGDFSILWSVMGMMGLGGTTVLTRKIRKTEEEA